MVDQPVLIGFQDDPTLYLFWCEGCNYCHHLDTKRWKWNGDLVRPTASPSLLINGAQDGGHPKCHIFIKAGKIQYLTDCTHKLAGSTVDMVPPP